MSPPSLQDDLQLSITGSILRKKKQKQKKQHEIRLRSFLSGATPPKKNTGSAPGKVALTFRCLDLFFCVLVQALYQ